ncbi:MAG: hypothetical protein WA117_19485 [Verrucomicrobiia bacterium]
MQDPYFLTEVAQDWNDSNLSRIQSVLSEAKNAVLQRSDITQDPLLDTPNLRNIRGYLRWTIVQKLLADAASNNQFDGITSEWVDLGSVYTLRLRGQYTTLTPCYLSDRNRSPQDTEYRKNLRIQNQVSPLLLGWTETESTGPANDLLHLLLVHGGKYEDFAELRAYTSDKEYTRLSRNIMINPMLLPSLDAEVIAEPEPTLINTTSVEESSEAQG